MCLCLINFHWISSWKSRWGAEPAVEMYISSSTAFPFSFPIQSSIFRFWKRQKTWLANSVTPNRKFSARRAPFKRPLYHLYQLYRYPTEQKPASFSAEFFSPIEPVLAPLTGASYWNWYFERYAVPQDRYSMFDGWRLDAGDGMLLDFMDALEALRNGALLLVFCM